LFPCNSRCIALQDANGDKPAKRFSMSVILFKIKNQTGEAISPLFLIFLSVSQTTQSFTAAHTMP
jgi:hypothetical protein